MDAMFSVVQVKGNKDETKEGKDRDRISNKSKVSRRKISSPCYTFNETREREREAQNESFPKRKTNDCRVLTRTRSGSESMIFHTMNGNGHDSEFYETQGYPINLSPRKYGLQTPEPCTTDQEIRKNVNHCSRTVSFSSQSMVHSSISRDDVAELSELIDSDGLDLNLPDEAGITMLHRAATDGSYRCLNCLLSLGADVDVTDHEGWTPLHDAVFHGQTRCAVSLLSAGADVEAETKDFLKPIEMAENEGMILAVGRAMASNSTRKNLNYDKETLV